MVKSFLLAGNDEGCVLTIFTSVARPSLSDDGIDSYLCSPPLLPLRSRTGFCGSLPPNFQGINEWG